MFRRFFADRRGNFALILEIMAPILLGVAGIAIDYSIFISQRSQMQEAADSAALAAIREASVAGWSQQVAEAAVSNFVHSALSDGRYADSEFGSTVAIDEKAKRIRVDLTEDGHGYFMLGLYLQHPQIAVRSEAALASATNVCVLATDAKMGGAIDLAKKSSIVANNCSVFANSTDPKAILVDAASRITAQSICSSGGWSGNPSAMSPEPITDCPQLDDPLADRKPPSFGHCDFQNTAVKIATILKPGVYCGGIKADGAAVVTLLPGVYVIKDGDLEMSGNATMIGVNVGFYLTGTAAKVRFANSSNVSLTAPKTGAMAGILFFEDRNSPTGRVFEISSKDARTLVGTIYLPKALLEVKGKSKFAELSDWTAIIVRELQVENGPEIHLNSDYAGSDIPVPDGIAGESGRVFLTE